MTVDQLIGKLNQFPGDMDVVDNFYLDVTDAKLVEIKDQKMVMIT